MLYRKESVLSKTTLLQFHHIFFYFSLNGDFIWWATRIDLLISSHLHPIAVNSVVGATWALLSELKGWWAEPLAPHELLCLLSLGPSQCHWHIVQCKLFQRAHCCYLTSLQSWYVGHFRNYLLSDSQTWSCHQVRSVIPEQTSWVPKLAWKNKLKIPLLIVALFLNEVNFLKIIPSLGAVCIFTECLGKWTHFLTSCALSKKMNQKQINKKMSLKAKGRNTKEA